MLYRGVQFAKSLPMQYFIDTNILQNSLININIDIFKKVHIDIDIDIFKNDHVDIDIDIDIFQKCRYIDNRYSISIYRTPLLSLQTLYIMIGP